MQDRQLTDRPTEQTSFKRSVEKRVRSLASRITGVRVPRVVLAGLVAAGATLMVMTDASANQSKAAVDLNPDQVVDGNLSSPDYFAQAYTGDPNQSFLRGLADYAIMDNYGPHWGLPDNVDPHDPVQRAKLNEYRAISPERYQAERQALEDQITLETLQRYPGRAGVFSVALIDGRQETMISHVLSDGTRIVPVLPNRQATGEVMARARAMLTP